MDGFLAKSTRSAAASATPSPARATGNTKQRLRLASFFTGIGGFDLGFEQAGADVVFQCEIDPHCQQVLNKHWPDVPLHDDITTLEAGDIPYADIWSAGWPCQDLSNANSQREGLSGARSGLFFRFIELARTVRPRWIILENVPGLLSADGGSAFESVIDQIEEVGYLGGWTTSNTLDFGLPQNRERVVLVASLGTDSAYNVLAHGSRLHGDHQTRGEQRKGSAAETAGGAGGHDPVVVQRRGGFGYTKGSDICPTLRAQTGKHQGGHSDRPILCGEELDLERMRAVDGVSGRLDGRRGRLIGNAVAVPLARWFATQIMLADEGLLPACD
ncbi:MAG: DNA (cytosine-5-)-methyltransferase [Chloroflexi bacterium]|nr:DNA (cytosine-5-)-methyltransferase [Chloroflexota bacterium]